MLYSVKSVKEIQDLNPFIVVGCGGGGEKFSNLEGVEAIGFIDDDVKKQTKPFCGRVVCGNLEDCLKENPHAKSLADDGIRSRRFRYVPPGASQYPARSARALRQARRRRRHR